MRHREAGGLVGFNLKPDQQRALKQLYMGSDLCLIYIAATGFGKTIVYTGYTPQSN